MKRHRMFGRHGDQDAPLIHETAGQGFFFRRARQFHDRFFLPNRETDYKEAYRCTQTKRTFSCFRAVLMKLR